MYMPKIYEELGKKVRTYRKTKEYSTAELAKKLDVSAGLINNIENSRNDVFRLELLLKLIQELDIPIEDILGLETLNIGNLNLDQSNNSLSIINLNLDSDVVQLLNHNVNLILRVFLNTALEYNCNKQSIEDISKCITNNLQVFRCIKKNIS